MVREPINLRPFCSKCP